MSVNIYVGNLPYTYQSSDLETLFGEKGTVASAQDIMDRDTGRSRGFGFVEMANDDEGRAAISEFNGQEVEGRRLNVNEARPREPRR